MEDRKRVSFKELFGWCMFDFANSSYTTVIITVVFGDIFSRLIVPAGDDPANPHRLGNILWAIALAISYILVVITGPIFGAITDFSARKKQFLFFSYFLCILSTASLYFASGPGVIWIPFLLIIVSNFAFASGENFVSSFLPFLGPKEDLGKISGYAWAIGYFGGLASVALVRTLGEVNVENFENLRWVGPYTAAFFLLTGIPTFLFLKEYTPEQTKPDNRSYIEIGFSRVMTTLRDIGQFRDLGVYLISLFFSMASLGIVISFAFIYGAQEVKIEDHHRVVMFVVLQFTAAFGAFAFGFIQDRIGALKTFNITLVVWILCVLFIFKVDSVTEILNSAFNLSLSVQWMFVGITSFAGMGLGATQSSSRAIVGLFSPESKSGEFFGLWGLSGKIAAAIGLFAVSILQSLFDFKSSFLIIAVFFALSLFTNFLVDEKRGREAAINFKE
ncbi:MAG: MFS transporter [Leptospiraceae bacterium]|nr:MFS transporter [Leptospiraceae bacterium]MCP5511732.1 MFS transporter [Leptospiraceae bacterium]